MAASTLTAGPGLVSVPGGDLAFEVHAGETAPVLAVHGVSSTRRLWSWVHAAAPELTLVAPDLRGRGDSVDVAGPFGLRRHADDLVRLLDHLGLAQVVVAGMSMGAFVAVHLADRHPDRVSSLVLVDGGFPMPVPPGLTRENVATAFADRTSRLEHPWPSVSSYVEHVVATTTPLLDPADPVLQHCLAHDLDADGRVRLSAEALVEDARSVFFGDTPWDALVHPVRFLHAQWSVGRDTPPAYDAAAVRRYSAVCTRVVPLPGADHAATVMSARGGLETADLIREALEETA
ncbi:alpha/beta fold hydrolase [Lapillicoccus jejuensis]|uniref:Pimeloyl-ACP methyl ester carboxylesterase n=1 Tax=Lapillicoccus jejuensis TaxID=402171 RepID=A0A542DZK1_9MICO|nr:alpha/beta hydrolase [Lapillicoccus jejuensis]TQJ08520.1 pimeloyl-ACP methyl ester carboxylesterase [Lapillicoccus jejuensis]